MDLTKFATDLFLKKIGSAGADLDAGLVGRALGNLLGASEEVNLASIIAQLNDGGLATLAQSWLADGPNDGISPQQVLSLLGDNAVGAFADRINLDKQTATNGLASMLPELIDSASEGGNLLDVVGGAKGLFGAASKLFR